MTRRGLAGVSVGLVAAALTGYLLAGRGSQPRKAALAPAPAAQLEALDRAALRAMLREELLALRDARPGEPAASSATSPAPTAPVPAATDSEPTPAAPPTREQDLQYESGRQILDGALARGTWTDADRAGFRGIIMTVTREQRLELLAELAPAINEGRLKLVTAGPPF